MRQGPEIAQPLEHQYPGKLVLGMDEAGRGPIAGPLTVAGVVFPAGYENPEIYDSKKLSEKKRERLYRQILEDALYVRVLFVDEETIDRENIYRATQQAMETIALSADCDTILTDAMKLPDVARPWETVVKGDRKSLSIAAASILAKVSRDRYMKQLDALYPGYGLARHKGYPTKAHLEALERLGVKPFYRRSYGPVMRLGQRLFDVDWEEKGTAVSHDE